MVRWFPRQAPARQQPAELKLDEDGRAEWLEQEGIDPTFLAWVEDNAPPAETREH